MEFLPGAVPPILTWIGFLNLQKRAIRIVDHSSFYAHTEPIFKTHNILIFQDIYRYETGIFMYLCFKSLLPESLRNHFVLNYNVHSCVTRSNEITIYQK